MRATVPSPARFKQGACSRSHIYPIQLYEREQILSSLSQIEGQGQGWSLLQSGPKRMSLRVFLTKLQPCSPASTQPVTVTPSPILAPVLAPQGPRWPCHLPSSPQTPVELRLPGLLRPGSFVLDDLRRYSVDLRYTVFQTTGSVPISTVISSEASGSRTIIHAYRFVHPSAPCQLPPPLPSLSSQSRTLSPRPACSGTAPHPAGGPGPW